MKRVMFIAITWVASLPVLAQACRGDSLSVGVFRAYGEANKSKSGSTTEKDGSTTYLSLMPTAGYFLSSRIAVGAGIGFDTQINKDPHSTIIKALPRNLCLIPLAGSSSCPGPESARSLHRASVRSEQNVYY